MRFVDALSPPEFARLVRQLSRVASAAGLRMPGFVSPPSAEAATRTIKWLAGDGALVAVRRADRAAEEVVHDMIDGVVAANRLSGSEAADTARKLAACLSN